MSTTEPQQQPKIDLNNFISEILPEDFLKKYIGKNPEWGFGGLGYIVYKRTYARILDDGINTEEWWQTVARCINGAQKIGARYTPEEAKQLYDLMFNLKCTFAGRMLWQLGTSTVDRFGANSLLNCWFSEIKQPDDFCFLFENLMLGGGVGFSVKKEDIHELPKIKKGVFVTHKLTKDADYIVPDSREGWVNILKNVLNALFVTGKSFTYSTILVRGAGEKISGFGGSASGPRILIDGLDKIIAVIKARESKKLRSIDVLDICNIIGSIVVSGNVRRSAEISIGDPDDFHFLRAKRWDLGKIPNWRAMSNNTIGADSYDQISNSVWEGFEGNGEAYGLFNLPLSSKYGRLGEKRFDNCSGINPCLTGDTLITTNKGDISLQELVESGENFGVATLDVTTNKITFEQVINKGLTKENANIISIHCKDGTVLKLTPNHEIFVKEKGWIYASLLEKGDQVLKLDDNSVSELEVDFIDIEENMDVYDITTEKNHNFFANGILVHNCAEILLADKECCNLAETFLNNITSSEELNLCVQLLYKTQKAICSLPFIHEETNKIVHENMRIGSGVTGICQSISKLEWLDAAYKNLRAFDKEWSKVLGVNESIRLTTVKPSGCTSLDTQIKTSLGNLSMEQIFILNGLIKSEITDLIPGTWIKPTFDINVTDSNNMIQPITMLYFNGVKETYDITFEDGQVVPFTANHKLMTTTGWKRVDELTTDDDIVSY